MAESILSPKRLQIDKANTSMVAIVAVSAFVTVFCLFACKALLAQRSYQAKVIKEKTKALNQLKANNQAASQLVEAYKTFASGSTNAIGGNVTGSGDRDGDNAKIVLDALPSKYDFPALATSLEKILTSKNLKINSISGVDDELNQSQEASGKTQPVQIPFEVSITGNYSSIQNLTEVFQRSIRPIVVSKLDFTGKDNELTMSVTANTYYQPEKKVNIRTEVVK